MRDPCHVLLDDWAVIENLGHVVARCSDELDAACMGCVIRPRTREGRQERVMHVDDCRRKTCDKSRRKNLHVARQHDQIDGVAIEQPQLMRLSFGARSGR